MNYAIASLPTYEYLLLLFGNNNKGNLIIFNVNMHVFMLSEFS